MQKQKRKHKVPRAGTDANILYFERLVAQERKPRLKQSLYLIMPLNSPFAKQGHELLGIVDARYAYAKKRTLK